MKKALRRYQQRCARVRVRRFLWDYFSHPFVRERPWRAENQLGAYLMNEPGWWVREFVTRPARVRSNALLNRARRGADMDGTLWPDYRRPHVYYW